MRKEEIEAAFQRLGERGADLECVIVGSAAAILSGWLNRGTLDIDVVHSHPKLSHFVRVISEIAEELGLPDKWMNEIEYVRSQLERIAAFDAPAAHRMELYLSQQ